MAWWVWLSSLLIVKFARQRFRYSLRTLFVLMVLFAIACSWFAVRMKRARRQEEAVKAIREAGGYVWYGSSSTPPGPAWMRKLLGNDFFATVNLVVSMGNDADLKLLKGLSNLRTLDLTNTHVTDAELEALEGLAKLQLLCLRNTQITDAGLQHVRALTSLGHVNLSRTRVTEEGVKKLQQALPNCHIELRD